MASELMKNLGNQSFSDSQREYPDPDLDDGKLAHPLELNPNILTVTTSFKTREWSPNTLMAYRYQLFMGAANDFINIASLGCYPFPYEKKWGQISKLLIDFLKLDSISPFIVTYIADNKLLSLQLSKPDQRQNLTLPREIQEKLENVIFTFQQLIETKKEMLEDKNFFRPRHPQPPSALLFKKITQRSEILESKPMRLPTAPTHPFTKQVTKLLDDNPEIPDDLKELLYDFLDYRRQTGDFLPIGNLPVDRQLNEHFLLFMSKCCRVLQVPDKWGLDPIENNRLAYFYFLRRTIKKEIKHFQGKIKRSNIEELKIQCRQTVAALFFLFDQIHFNSLFFDPAPYEGIVVACYDLIKKYPSEPLLAFKEVVDLCFAAQLTTSQGRDFSSINDVVAIRAWLEEQISKNLQAIVPIGKNLDEVGMLKNRILYAIRHLFANIEILMPRAKVSNGHLTKSSSTLDEPEPSSPRFFDRKAPSLFHLPHALKTILMTDLDIYDGETDRDTILKKGNMFFELCVTANLTKTVPKDVYLLDVERLDRLKEKMKEKIYILFDQDLNYAKKYEFTLTKKIEDFLNDYIRVVRKYRGLKRATEQRTVFSGKP